MISLRPLILGAAVGYRWPQMETFARTLRHSGCKAKVILLVGRIDAETRHNLARYDITPLAIHPIVARLPQHLARKRFNRYWLGWLHRSFPHVIGASPEAGSARNALLARAASWFHHPACSRYFSYYRYLRTRLPRYSHVLITDVRDVLFQADPFSGEWIARNGMVFLEHDAVHGSEPGNDRWIDTGFGAEGLAAVLGRRVTCSGTTLGTAPLMLAYLAKMIRQLAFRTDRLTGYDGVDQGVHNWLYWTGQLPGFEAVENFHGPVLTMHGMPSPLLRKNPDGRIIDPLDRVIPILHQYDRHPSLFDPLPGN